MVSTWIHHLSVRMPDWMGFQKTIMCGKLNVSYRGYASRNSTRDVVWVINILEYSVGQRLKATFLCNKHGGGEGCDISASHKTLAPRGERVPLHE